MEENKCWEQGCLQQRFVFWCMCVAVAGWGEGSYPSLRLEFTALAVSEGTETVATKHQLRGSFKNYLSS